jgi:hypothetical protein
MPSRVATAKLILSASALGLTPPNPTRPRSPSLRNFPTQPHGFQVATPQALNLTPSCSTTSSRTVNRLSPASLLPEKQLLCRHHHHHSTSMDPALAKIFMSNSQWLNAVNAKEPEFFEQSAKGQSPKVRVSSFPLILLIFHMYACRSSGLDAQTRESRRASSPLLDRVISLSTVISPSVFLSSTILIFAGIDAHIRNLQSGSSG